MKRETGRAHRNRPRSLRAAWFAATLTVALLIPAVASANHGYNGYPTYGAHNGGSPTVVVVLPQPRPHPTEAVLRAEIRNLTLRARSLDDQLAALEAAPPFAANQLALRDGAIELDALNARLDQANRELADLRSYAPTDWGYAPPAAYHPAPIAPLGGQLGQLLDRDSFLLLRAGLINAPGVGSRLNLVDRYVRAGVLFDAEQVIALASTLPLELDRVELVARTCAASAELGQVVHVMAALGLQQYGRELMERMRETCPPASYGPGAYIPPTFAHAGSPLAHRGV